MAKNRGDGPVTISVLDRLIHDPNELESAFETRLGSLRKLKEAVRRDLEWLLNTRQPVIGAPEGSEAQNSLFMYGLPDITSMSVKSTRERKRLTEAIQTAVAKFEPRMANVRVNLVTVGEDRVPNLRFVIEGLLRVDPSPEQVSFDTVLELSSGEYKVQGETSAR
ncbi:MAG: type VI secretion system baseplate subunit TssE [Acidobacteriaceae bacterium]|nr:type VI secretion system baseplate subunit TssE [Acidobacteriaceae bacterium]MBV9296216.1 type VI secretion system baseplate subunit TssE [Acidobacteriaceae bacterium]MBV9765857.1 type VI secretion system baseplate subunit TssE [Acidobacteriaceae bacterium]